MKNALTVQTEAVEAILSTPTQGKQAASYGLTVLNRKARRVAAIRKSVERDLAACGFTTEQISRAWEDVKDMAKLEASAQENQ